MKSNDCEATLRKGNLPPASTITDTTNEDKGAAIRCAKKQNGGNVIPLTLASEEKTATAREDNSGGAYNSDVADHK